MNDRLIKRYWTNKLTVKLIKENLNHMNGVIASFILSGFIMGLAKRLSKKEGIK